MRVLTQAATGSTEWLSARKGKIGGNMAADILGVGRRTPLQAWAELTGKVEPEDISKLAHVRRGNYLESAILKGFSGETGYILQPTPGLVSHDLYEFLAGTPDALYTRLDGRWGVVDAKAVGFYKVNEWKLGVPLRVKVQTTFYAALLGELVDWTAAAAMPIDEDDDAEPILWDEEIVNPLATEGLINKLVEFWEKHVQTDIPPEFDPVADRSTLKALFPHDTGEAFEMNEVQAMQWSRIEELRDTIKPLEDEKKTLTAMLEADFGDRTWMVGPGYRLRYQQEHRASYTVPDWSGRVLRRVKLEGAK